MTGTLAGSWKYMSPQVFKGEEYGKKTDIWSLGVVFGYMTTLEPLTIDLRKFKRLDPNALKVAEELIGLRDCICNQMVVKEEVDRATIEQVIGNVVFANFYSTVEAKANEWETADALGEGDGDGTDEELRVKLAESEQEKAKMKKVSEKGLRIKVVLNVSKIL